MRNKLDFVSGQSDQPKWQWLIRFIRVQRTKSRMTGERVLPTAARLLLGLSTVSRSHVELAMDAATQSQVPVPGAEERRRCQSIALNLLRNKDVEATFYVREWDQLERCDKFHDTKDVRGAFRGFIGDASLKRIRAYDTSVEKDELLAAQAVFHYSDWCDRRLYQSLDWKNKAVYQTFDRASRLLDAVGLVTLGYGGVKAVSATVRSVATRRAAKKAAEDVANAKKSD